tara:strand:+ start:297 stop:512 length:216 start_codon:yes stop_codon:yes gene_type:complete
MFAQQGAASAGNPAYITHLFEAGIIDKKKHDIYLNRIKLRQKNIEEIQKRTLISLKEDLKKESKQSKNSKD